MPRVRRFRLAVPSPSATSKDVWWVVLAEAFSPRKGWCGRPRGRRVGTGITGTTGDRLPRSDLGQFRYRPAGRGPAPPPATKSRDQVSRQVARDLSGDLVTASAAGP